LGLSLRPGADTFSAYAVTGLKEPCRGENETTKLYGARAAAIGRRTGDRMRRREFIGVIYGAALASPCAVHAQQPGNLWRVGDVFSTTPERGAYLAQALERWLADLGHVQGRNVELSDRFTGPNPGELQKVIVSLLPQIDLLVV
jgi:hypothetical protein